jgi:hypothetical protein
LLVSLLLLRLPLVYWLVLECSKWRRLTSKPVFACVAAAAEVATGLLARIGVQQMAQVNIKACVCLCRCCCCRLPLVYRPA